MCESRESILDKFQETVLEVNLSCLSQDIQQAIPHLKAAMNIITRIYLRQQREDLPTEFDNVMNGNDEKQEFYKFFKGPWNPLDNYKSVVTNVPDRVPGCAFYPDLTKKDLESYIAKLPEKDQKYFTDHYTIIRRGTGKELKTIPFHIHYASELSKISEHLKKAASEVKTSQQLRNYLFNRAESLVSGDYRQSDIEWVQMRDTPLEFVIGPIEVYQDRLMGIKAAYESLLMTVDHEKSNAFREIESNIKKLAAVFPLPKGSKPSIGKVAPIVIVNQIASSGEAEQGVMASAFNLPNDPWVRGQIGWKQVMIHNIFKAKFENCTVRIADRVMKDKTNLEFDVYFNFVLLHEVSHGLGPAYRANGVDVSKSLGASFTAIEETKADVGAIFLLLHFGGEYGIPKYDIAQLLNAYVAQMFRSMRFGVHEAHGAANVIQFNWFKEWGVIKSEANNKFSTDAKKFIKATDALLDKICNIQANASPDQAERFVDKYSTVGNNIDAVLKSLSDLPIDIRVTYKYF